MAGGPSAAAPAAVVAAVAGFAVVSAELFELLLPHDATPKRATTSRTTERVVFIQRVRSRAENGSAG
jgi:hypothetical protein